MKYPCNVIRDLLPLFHDGVCSEESAQMVQEHLAECADCRDRYDKLCESEDILPEAADPAEEKRKVQSFVKIRVKMNRRLKAVWALVAVLVLVVAGVVYAWNEHGEMFMPPQESMRVCFDENGDLVLLGDLPCSGVMINQILIPGTEDGQQKNHVFVRYFCRPLDYYFGKLTGFRSDSLYVLGFAEKGAQEIDAVHYVTKDFESRWFRGDIPVSEAELEQYIDASVTLWEKE